MKYQILTIPVTPFLQNARILIDNNRSQCVVVDPGGEGSKLLEIIESHSVKLSEIWLTHSHLDHCGGVSFLKKATGAILVGTDDPFEKTFRQKVSEQCRMYGIPDSDMEPSPEPDKFISDGDEVTFGESTFKVIFTPGHSPGHVCYYDEAAGVLLAGDALFQGSIGRTDLPGGNYDTLISSIKGKIMPLPDAVKVLPGHGPDTTVGNERRTNPFLIG